MADDGFKITLRAARVNAGFKQKEVAELMGVSNATLVKWEQNPALMPGERISQICKIYKIPTSRVIFLPFD